jgi:predicted dehydrogenase
MRRLIAQGVLGEPVHVDSYYPYDLDGPFGRAIMGDPDHWVHALPGRLVHNNIDHILAKIVEHLPIQADVHLQATGYTLRQKRWGDRRDDAIDELRFTVRAGSVSAHGMFSAHVRPAAHFARICGTKNTLVVDYTKRTLTLESQSALPSALGRLLPAFDQGLQLIREASRNVVRFARNDFHYLSGLGHLLRLFYGSILDDGEPPIPYAEILRIAAMTDEIFRQVPQ